MINSVTYFSYFYYQKKSKQTLNYVNRNTMIIYTKMKNPLD